MADYELRHQDITVFCCHVHRPTVVMQASRGFPHQVDIVTMADEEMEHLADVFVCNVEPGAFLLHLRVDTFLHDCAGHGWK